MYLIQASDNNYRSRISFNMYRLSLDYYTFCIEFFVPDLSKFQSINCVSSVLEINKQITKKFPTYIRAIINFRKGVQTTPVYLDIDMHLSGASSPPSQPHSSNQLPCHMIVYGISGTHTNVNPTVFDSLYFIENNKLTMQTDLDMNKHDIINSSTITQLQTTILHLRTLINQHILLFYEIREQKILRGVVDRNGMFQIIADIEGIFQGANNIQISSILNKTSVDQIRVFSNGQNSPIKSTITIIQNGRWPNYIMPNIDFSIKPNFIIANLNKDITDLKSIQITHVTGNTTVPTSNIDFVILYNKLE